MTARLTRITSVAAQYGIQISKPSRRGSHWRAKKAGYRTYPIPAHKGNKTVIDDQYIDGLCRNFDIDPKEFKDKL